MDKQELIEYIISNVYENETEDVSGQAMQDTLVEMVEHLYNNNTGNGNCSGGFDISEEETLTGRHCEGKPTYVRTWKGSIPGGIQNNRILLLSGVDTIVSQGGMCANAQLGYYFTLETLGARRYTAYILKESNSDMFLRYYYDTSDVKEYEIWVEYTKVIDEQISPGDNPNAVCRGDNKFALKKHEHTIPDIENLTETLENINIIINEYNITEILADVTELQQLLIIESGTWTPQNATIRNISNPIFSRIANNIALSASFGFTTSGDKIITGIPRMPRHTIRFMITSDNDFVSVATLSGSTLNIASARHNGLYYLYVMYEMR